MRTFLSLAVASALIASPLAAQAAAGRMETPCPMHLTDLALTPVQDSAFVAIRAAHRAEVRAVHARLGLETPAGHEKRKMHADHPAKADDPAHEPAHDAMKASMARSIEAARAVLTDAQRVRFDAAVTAHKAEKEKLSSSGTKHSCGDCCPDHDARHEG
jgi:hypothetical protein